MPYTFTLDRLEAAVGRRVCHTELWNVSPTWTGWQSMLASTFAIQPVATADERADALARARDVARYLDTEIANLSEGLAEGYTAPRSNVDRVLDQVDAPLAAPVEVRSAIAREKQIKTRVRLRKIDLPRGDES